jgi:hypothetical protein
VSKKRSTFRRLGLELSKIDRCVGALTKLRLRTGETMPPRTTYFHCAAVGLSIGSEILPGNWGRVMGLYEYNPTQNQGLPTNVFREALFELSRQIHAPDRPSRLSCVFACPTFAEAAKFRDKYQKSNLIYQVVPVADDVVIHVGDYELVLAPYPARYFQSMFDFARGYWTNPTLQNPEVLLSCAVRIVSPPLYQAPPADQPD